MPGKKKNKISKEERIKEHTIRLHNTRKIYFFAYVMMLILVGIIIWIKSQGKEISTGVFVAVAVFIILGIKFTEIHRLQTSYEVNPLFLIFTRGILNKKIRKVDLFSISDLDVKQNILQRLLNFGDVNVRVFSDDVTIPVKSINHPQEFASFLHDRVSEKRKLEDWY